MLTGKRTRSMAQDALCKLEALERMLMDVCVGTESFARASKEATRMQNKIVGDVYAELQYKTCDVLGLQTQISNLQAQVSDLQTTSHAVLAQTIDLHSRVSDLQTPMLSMMILSTAAILVNTWVLYRQ